MSDNPAREFQSYLFFLRHFSALIRAGRHAAYGNPLLVAISVAQAPLIANAGPDAFTVAEQHNLRKYLFTAWNSECVARLSSLFDPEVRRFTNQWKPVQSYYATYFGLVASQYAVAKRIQRAHEPTINYATNSLVHWMPVPWCCRLNYDSHALHHFPPNTATHGPSGWNLANNEPYFHLACSLRITAFRRQSETLSDLRRRRRRIPAGQARAGRLYTRGDVRAGTVSFFDVLWRFRRWANYHEGDTIIEGGEVQDHAVEFDARFNEIMDTTALLCESVVGRKVGTPALRAWYDEFLHLTQGRMDTMTVERRRAILCP